MRFHFIIRQGQAGNPDRKNNHFRESYIGRASLALRVNHADVSVRGFYPKCALYTPRIRWHGTSPQLRGPRRPPGVPCAAAVPAPGAAVAPAGHTRAGRYRLQVSHVTLELLTPLAQLFSLRLLPFIIVDVVLLWRRYSNRSFSYLSPGEM